MKKIISLLSMLALSATMFSNLAYADTDTSHNYTLGSGISYTDTADEYGSQYFTLYNKDVVGENIFAFCALIEIESNILGTTPNYDFAITKGEKLQAGLYVPGRSKSYLADTNYTVNFSTNGDKQIIKISGAYSEPVKTDDGALLEFWITPQDKSSDVEFELLAKAGLTHSLVTVGETNGANKVTYMPEYNDSAYVIKANTSKVAKKNATEKFNAVQTAGADTFEVGFGANLTLSDAQNTGSTEVLWTLKNSANDKSTSDTVTYSYDTEGISGNIKVGLIVNGIAEADQANWNNVTATAGIVE